MAANSGAAAVAVHAVFIEHMELARRVAERTGGVATEAQVLRIMRKYSLGALRQLLEGR